LIIIIIESLVAPVPQVQVYVPGVIPKELIVVFGYVVVPLMKVFVVYPDGTKRTFPLPPPFITPKVLPILVGGTNAPPGPKDDG